MALDSSIELEVRDLAAKYNSYREMKVKEEGLREMEGFHRSRIMQICVAEEYDFKPYIDLYDGLIQNV